MTLFQLVAGLMAVVALASWLNAMYFRLPHAVAMLIAGLLMALALFGLQSYLPNFPIGQQITNYVNGIDFVTTVTGYMLAFLLFAGAVQVDLEALQEHWFSISTLALLGVLGSVVVVGYGVWVAARFCGIPLTLPWALVFGALISPTDLVAVFATIRQVKLSKSLTMLLQGEALFNDGVGIVTFTALVAVSTGAGHLEPVETVLEVIVEAAGGLLLGMMLGKIAIYLMGKLDEFAVEVSMTIALAMGTFAIAEELNLSGAIAVVGAGILFGGKRGKEAIKGQTEAYVIGFWTLVDEILNALLFLLLGVEVIAVPFFIHQLWFLALAVALVVAARFIVVLPWATFYRFRRNERAPSLILGWGGLHGAVSLALALTLPSGPERMLILSMTYAVVAFSVAVQGLTFMPLAKWVSDHAVKGGVSVDL